MIEQSSCEAQFHLQILDNILRAERPLSQPEARRKFYRQRAILQRRTSQIRIAQQTAIYYQAALKMGPITPVLDREEAQVLPQAGKSEQASGPASNRTKVKRRFPCLHLADVLLVVTILMAISYCTQRFIPNDLSNAPGFRPCETPDYLRNLDCNSAYLDENAPITLAFPGNTRSRAISPLRLIVNEPGSITYYTTDGSSPTPSGPIYTNALNIQDTEQTVRWFSVDTAGNLEVVRFAKYFQDDDIATLTLESLDKFYINEQGRAQLLVSVAPAQEILVELGGTGAPGSGVLLWSGPAGQGTQVAIDGADLDTGLNELFVIAAGGDRRAASTIAYSSFSIVRDDNPPYVQASPDVGTFAQSQQIALFTVEPADIHYVLTTADPGSPALVDFESPLYSGPVQVPQVAGSEAGYQLSYVARDLAGNSSEPITKSYTIDAEFPEISPSDGTGLYGTVVGYQPYVAAGDPPTWYVSSAIEVAVDWSASESGTYSFEIGGDGPSNGSVLASGDYSAGDYVTAEVSPAQLQPGFNTLNLYVTDAVGNTTTALWQIYYDDEVITPRLIQPLLGWNEKNDPITLTWQDVAQGEADLSASGLDIYELEISANVDFASASRTTEFVNQKTLSLADGLYYWRVRAIDLAGNISPWSTARHFYTGRTSSDVAGSAEEDLLVGAPGYQSNRGRAYLFTADLGAGNSPYPDNVYYIFEGQNTDDRFGYRVAIVGDMDGGGRADIAISAPYAQVAGAPNAGRVYVFFGENLDCPTYPTTPCIIGAASADVTIRAAAGGDNLGRSLATAGDYNKDGLADLIIGAPQASGNFVSSGVAYLLFGRTSWVSSIKATHSDLIFNGLRTAEQFGSCVAGAGDLNGDSYADIIVGASAGDTLLGLATGVVKVYLGSSQPDASADSFLLGSEFAGSDFGHRCLRAFDTDEDGFEDVLVGAPTDPSFGTNYGKSYLYFGGELVFTVPGTQFQAGQPGGLAGSSLLAFYYDGDTQADLLMGAPGAGNGQAYGFLGSNLTNPLNFNELGEIEGQANETSSVDFIFSDTGADGMGLWGDIDSSGSDAIGIGDTVFNGSAGLVRIYKGSTSPAICLSGDGVFTCGAVSATNSGEEFGFSLSYRP